MLKYPCRKFLHLAAGAAGRVAKCKGASLSDATGAPARWLSSRWPNRGSRFSPRLLTSTTK